MYSSISAERRAVQLLAGQLGDSQAAQFVLNGLRSAGIRLADENNNELVCRWVNVTERAVPPDADTIIRTITTTTADGQSWSTTHWLDGLRGPRT